MSAALAYGGALGAAGALLAAGLAAGHRERIMRRLGPVTAEAHRGIGPRRTLLRRLDAGAARRGWPGNALAYGVTLIAAALVAGGVGFRLAGPVGGLAGLVGGPAAVEGMLARRRERHRQRLEEQLREGVAAMAAGVRAGLSIRRALEEATRDAEWPLRDHLAAIRRRLDVGEPLEAALDALAADLGSAEARLVTTVLDVHRRTGGDLPAMLDEVADIVGQRVEARRQVRSLTAQGRASGVVLAVLPVAFVTLLSGTSGDGLGAFYRTPLGTALLVAGLACEALGFAWIRRIVRSRG